MKITVQKEVYTGVLLQQNVVVEIVLKNFQCPNCHEVSPDEEELSGRELIG